MSGSLIARLKLALRLLAVGLGVLWMYASHRYDCLNIGPCTGDPGFWDHVLGWACYGFLAAWAGLLVLAAFRRGTNSGGTIATWTSALALPPAAVMLAHWAFNFGVRSTGG